MGQEKPGYVRTYGLVPNPSDVLGSTSSLSEAKMIATAEMSKMVEKMEAMEQRYTCMEAQITKMTSYMERFLKKQVRWHTLDVKTLILNISECNCVSKWDLLYKFIKYDFKNLKNESICSLYILKMCSGLLVQFCDTVRNESIYTFWNVASHACKFVPICWLLT